MDLTTIIYLPQSASSHRKVPTRRNRRSNRGTKVYRRGGREWGWDEGKVVNYARHVVSCARPRHLSSGDLMNVSYCLSKTTHKVSLSRAIAEREACCIHRMSLHRAVSFTNTSTSS